MNTHSANSTELMFANISPHTSIAIDMYRAFLLGLYHERLPSGYAVSNWSEWTLWMGPFCLSLTFYR